MRPCLHKKVLEHDSGGYRLRHHGSRNEWILVFATGTGVESAESAELCKPGGLGKMKSLILFLLILSTQIAHAAKIAVVAPGHPEMEALAVAALSKESGLELVDRAELSKISMENLVTNTGLMRPLDLESADGLLLIEDLGDAVLGKLFSTRHGIWVWSTQFPSGEIDPWPRLAPLIASAARKLTLPDLELMAVSILNFRAAAFSPEMARQERYLVRLVESALSQQPGTVVLERRHLGDAAFERALRENNPTLAGSLRLVDGSFDFANGIWSLDLRIRSPDGSFVEIADVSADSIEELALAVVKKVSGNSQAAESRPLEAEAFYQEAIWAERGKLDDIALQSAQSAEALGMKEPKLLHLLALLYARQVKPDPRFHGGKYLTPEPLSAELRYQNAMQSLDYADRLAALWEKVPREEIANACSEFLTELDADTSSPLDKTSLRARLRAFAPFDPSGKQAPYCLGYAADHAPTWADKPEEVIEFHRAWLNSDHKNRLWVVKRLYGNPEKTLGLRFPDNAHKMRLIQDFIAELKSDPRNELSGLMLEFSLNDPGISPAAYRQYLRKFSDRSSELLQSGEFERLVTAEFKDTARIEPFAIERGQRLIKVLPQLKSLQVEFLNTQFQTAYPLSQAQKIYSAFDEYRKRIVAAELDPGKKADLARMLAHFNSQFLDKHPGIEIRKNDDGLVVDQFWMAPDSIPAGREFYFNTAVPTDEGVWLSAGRSSANTATEFWRVSLPSLQSESLRVEGFVAPWQVAVTSDALIAVFARYPDRESPQEYSLHRFDFKERTWDQRPIRRVYDLFAYSDTLYLSLWDSGGRQEENGLLQYEWADKKETLLGSSRRRPPLNPLDEIADARIEAVRPLANGRLLIAQSAKRWQLLSVDPNTGEFEILLADQKLEGFNEIDGLLLAGQTGEVWHHDGSRLAHWLSREPGAKWQTPPDWNHEIVSSKRIASHAGRLFVLQRDENGGYFLKVFFEGGPGDGRSLPLSFKLPAAAKASIKALENQGGHLHSPLRNMDNPESSVPGLRLFASGQGLIIAPWHHGFWFLPFNDLDTVLSP